MIQLYQISPIYVTVTSPYTPINIYNACVVLILPPLGNFLATSLVRGFSGCKIYVTCI